jgi:hypothetical protein
VNAAVEQSGALAAVLMEPLAALVRGAEAFDDGDESLTIGVQDADEPLGYRIELGHQGVRRIEHESAFAGAARRISAGDHAHVRAGHSLECASVEVT